MKTNIRKIGNSSGMILPSTILKKLKLANGDEIEVSENGNQIVLTPISDKPKYTLKELLDECDINAPVPETIKEWDETQPVGQEIL